MGMNNRHSEGHSTPKAAANDTYLWEMPHGKGQKIQSKDPVRSRECTYRTTYKKRIKRLVALDTWRNTEFREMPSFVFVVLFLTVVWLFIDILNFMK